MGLKVIFITLFFMMFIGLMGENIMGKSVEGVFRKFDSKELKELKRLFPKRSVQGKHSFLFFFKKQKKEKQKKVYFTSVIEDGTKSQFYLVKDRRISFKFPLTEDMKTWFLYEIKAVAFIDMDFDDYVDVVIIQDFMTGIGRDGAKPFSISTVYFNKKNGKFNYNKNIQKKIGSMTSVSKIYKYMKKKYRRK
ncbi:MAG: hypothetical protein IEMM0008_1486 [bacterium]|nr:MAG: hypothetical protein IEMM0008_1486 [bacterium]